MDLIKNGTFKGESASVCPISKLLIASDNSTLVIKDNSTDKVHIYLKNDKFSALKFNFTHQLLRSFN